MSERWWIVPALGALGAIMFLVGVVTTPPATGYESSVYDAHHPLTWAGFALALVAGIGSLCRSVVAGERGWRHGVAIVASAYAVFFALPRFRGYFLNGTPLSDALYHFGIVRDLLSNGTVPGTGYPATHFLYAALVRVTGLPMHELQPIVALGFFALFAGAFYVAGRAFFGPDGGVATLAAALPLVFVSHQLATLPWLFALPFLPLLLGLAHRRAHRPHARSVGAFGSLTLCATALVVYHPLTALVGALSLLLYAVVVALPSHRGRGQAGSDRSSPVRTDRPSRTASDRPYPSLYRLPLFIVIPGVFWYLSIGRYTRYLARVIGGDVRGGVKGYSAAAQETSYSLSELLWEYVIIEWGTVVLYAGAGAIVAAALVVRVLRRRGAHLDLFFVVQFGAGIGLATLLIVSQFLSQNVVRLNNYTLVGAIFLIGFALITLAQVRPHLGGWRRAAVTVALGGLCLTVLTTGLLAGAVAYEDDGHISHTTMAGTAWQHDHHSATANTRALRMSEQLQRYFDGVSRSDPAERQFHRSLPAHQLPARLGYDEADTLGAVYDNETYLVTKSADVSWSTARPPDRRDEIRYYTRRDLERARDDPAVQRLYDNGLLTVWFVHPDAGSIAQRLRSAESTETGRLGRTDHDEVSSDHASIRARTSSR